MAAIIQDFLTKISDDEFDDHFPLDHYNAVKRPTCLEIAMSSNNFNNNNNKRKHYHATPLVLRRSEKTQQYDAIMSQSMFVGGSGQPSSTLISPDEAYSSGDRMTSSFYQQQQGLSSPNTSTASSNEGQHNDTLSSFLRRSSLRNKSAKLLRDSGWQFHPAEKENDLMTQSCITEPAVGKTLQVPTSIRRFFPHRGGAESRETSPSRMRNVRSRLMHILAVTPVVIRKSFAKQKEPTVKPPPKIEISSRSSPEGDEKMTELPVGGLLDRMHKAYYGCQQQVASLLSKPVPEVLGIPKQNTSSCGSNSSTLSSSNGNTARTTASSSSDETTSNQSNTNNKSSSPEVAEVAVHKSSLSRIQMLTRNRPLPLLSTTPSTTAKNATSQDELEAASALRWLKAAGFPQYYQMFIEGEFPVDLATVERDHDFLDADLLQPLLKRLRLLNEMCTNTATIAASRRLQHSQRSLSERPPSSQAKKSSQASTSETCEEDDGDVDDEIDTDCALSDRWKYQITLGRWARRDSSKQIDDVVDKTSPSVSRPRRIVMSTHPNYQHQMSSPLVQPASHLTDETTSLVVLATSGNTSQEGSCRGTSLASLPLQLPKVTSSESPPESVTPVQSVLTTSPSAASFPAQPLVDSNQTIVKRSASDANKSTVRPANRTVLGISGSKINRTRRLTTGITQETWRAQRQQSAAEKELSNAISYLCPEKATRPLNNPSLLPVQKHSTPLVAQPNAKKNLRALSCAYGPDSLSRGLSEASLTSETASRASYRDQVRFKEISTVFKECANILQSEMQLFGEASRPQTEQKPTLDQLLATISVVESPTVPPPPRGRLLSQQLTRSIDTPQVRSSSRHSLYDNLDELAHRSSVTKVAVVEPVAPELQKVPEIVMKPTASDGLDDILAELQNSMDVLQKSIDGSASIHDASLRFIDDSTRQAVPDTALLSVTLPPPLTTIVTPASSSATSSPPQIATPSPTDNKLQLPQQQSGGEQGTSTRERHDSGVGSSITRSPNEQQRRHRVRWHSFQKSHVPGFCTQDRRHISCMTAGQLNMLRKVALLNLTALVEQTTKDETNSSADLLIELNNWVKKPLGNKASSTGMFDALKPGSPRVFGATLSSVQQTTGQPLPLCILHAMRYVLHNCKDTLGIFRRSGVRTRIQQLKEELEANPERTDFEGLSPYDVGDLIKQYFRELPTCLFTSQLSAVMLRSPPESWLEVIENCLLLLPDENREVLHCLLLFLHDVATHADTHQMTSSNLAICFAPSLFSLSAVLAADVMPSRSPPRNESGHGHRRATKGFLGGISSGGNARKASSKSATAALPEIPDHRELMQQKTAHECLATMINNCQRIFTIAEDTLRCCRFSYIDQSFPLTLTQISEQHGGFENYLNSLIHRVTKEVNEDNNAWITVDCSNIDNDCQLTYQRPADGHSLRLWRSSTQVDAPPMELLKKIYHERHVWDPDVADFRILQKLNMSTEIVSYRVVSMAPEPPREFVELRTWLKRNNSVLALDQTNRQATLTQQDECLVVSTSIEHPGHNNEPEETCSRPRLSSASNHSIRGINLVTAFVIRPAGSGRSSIHMIARVDYRGRSATWYNAEGNFAAFCIASVRRLRDSFRRHIRTNQPQNAPESVV